MKRSVLKITALVLTFIMGMTLFAGNIFAASVPTDMMYSNKPGVTEENAEVVMSYMLDNTTPQPGDVITLTITLDKLPSNGLGIRSLSNRIGYDPEKLEPMIVDNTPKAYLIPGEVGTELGLSSKSAGLINVPTSNYYKCLSFGCAVSGDFAVTESGVFCKIRFKVKDDVTVGKVDLFILATQAPYAGFDLGGNKYDSNDNLVFNAISSWYVKTNMNELTIE